MKCTVSKIKKFTTGFQQTSDQAEERISELEERSNEIQSEEQKRIMKINEVY